MKFLLSVLLAIATVISTVFPGFKQLFGNKVDIDSHLSAFSDASKISYSELYYCAVNSKSETVTLKAGKATTVSF